MLKYRLQSALRGDFARREDGSVALETVILLPMLFWAFLSMFSIFDAFRQYAINQKAAFTIGDMISRETVPIDNDYLDGAQDLFDYLTRSRDEAMLRVTSIRYHADNNQYRPEWSQVRGDINPMNVGQVIQWGDRLPFMLDNETIMVVESWSSYDPPFNTGLENREIKNYIFTRPRYTPCILFDDGSGAGDC